ncbi:Hsp20/alpha crystallin family protein [Methylomarinum vadi]|uniref:Hsp20/alpha crystallin family protein n=1 Tax=Methylomarinum vadi TaxID=438855 RepID=UPI0004DEFC36|nr:Hsp20/alpha crystallin family protein [Methylomarinum vadi]
MTDTKSMKTTESGQVQRQAEREIVLLPAADIYEEATGITVKADLPGVSRERLEVHVDGDTLIIEGQAAIDMPEGMEALYADVNATRFRRSFTLSKELDADNISAKMNNGELTLHLPKRAEMQPRKIEVSLS